MDQFELNSYNNNEQLPSDREKSKQTNVISTVTFDSCQCMCQLCVMCIFLSIVFKIQTASSAFHDKNCSQLFTETPVAEKFS